MKRRIARLCIGLLVVAGAASILVHFNFLFSEKLANSSLSRAAPLPVTLGETPAFVKPDADSTSTTTTLKQNPPQVIKSSLVLPPATLRTTEKSQTAVSHPDSAPPAPPSNNFEWVKPLREKNPSECFKKFSALGYSESFQFLSPKVGAVNASSATCVWNPGSRSAICEAQNIMLDPAKVKVAQGGETIESVFGRREEDEFPIYTKGAFVAAHCEQKDVGSDRLPHYSKDVVNAFSSADAALPCEAWIEEPTLMITRYEYANLYHTATDWYNMWVALDWAGLLEARGDTLGVSGQQITRPKAHQVLWLDGHAAGSLDSVWGTLFSPSILRLGRLSQRTCFRRALIVPAGYSSPTYDWPDACDRQPAVREFAAFVLGQHGLSHIAQMPARATFLFREAYVAHPRNPGGAASRHVANRAEVEAVLAQHGGKAMNPVVLSFREQLQMVRESRLLIGVHGAGLTHVLFMDEGAKMLEMQPPTHPLQHFQKLARWAGVQYLGLPWDLALVAVGTEEYNVPKTGLEKFIVSHVDAGSPPAV